MVNYRRKISPLTHQNDATRTSRYAVPEEEYSTNIKESILKQRRQKALEEKREFVDNFKSGNDYYYDSLKKEAERQRKIEEERKKKEREARAKEERETQQKRRDANAKYDRNRDRYVNSQIEENTIMSRIAGALGAGLAGMGSTVQPATTGYNVNNADKLQRGIIGSLFDIKNQLGTTSESMDEGDLQATLGDITRVQQNLGAADAHARVLQLEQQKKDLYGVDGAEEQLQAIDDQLASLKDLDDLYKKTYVGENPIGFWSNVKEFFTDDLWEGIQDAMTYDSAKEYTKQRRTDEINQKYADTMRRKGIVTGDNRTYYTPLGTVNNTDLTRELKDIENFKKQQQDTYDGLTEEYTTKLKRYEDTKQRWNVDEGYKDLIEAYQNGDLFDKNYIFAEYAQMFGTSISSRAQLAATGARMAAFAGAGAAALTGNAWIAPWLINATELGVTGLDYAGAYHENLQERAMKYLDNVEALIKNPAIGGEEAYNRIVDDLKASATKAYRKAGLTEEQIKDRLSGKDAVKHLLADAAAGIISNEDPILKTAELYANRGLQAQQDANNFRTASDMILQKALVWMPIKAKSAIGGKTWAAVDRAAERAISNNADFVVEETAKKTLRSRMTNKAAQATEEAVENTAGAYKNSTLSNAIQSGYRRGMEVGAAAGYGLAGQQIAGVTGAALNSAAHLARTQLTPSQQRLLSQVERFASRKYQAVYDRLLKDHDFAKLALQYGYKQAKLHTLTGLSEGAEEAAQYIHEQNKTFASKYGWDGMSLGDMIIDDVTVGGEIMNAYLAMLGIGDSPWADDVQFRSNWKGGALLGFMNQSSVLNMAVQGQQTIKQYRVDKVLDNAAIVNRELDDRDRAAYADVVRNVMGNNTQYVLNYLDRMEREEARRENRVTTPQEIADTRRAVNRIAQIVNDKSTRKRLEESGIEYGSEEYVLAIADQYALENQYRNIIEQRQNGVGELAQVYNSKEFNDEIDDQVKIVNSQHQAYKSDKQNAKKTAGDKAVENAKKTREAELQFLNGQLGLEEAGLAGVDTSAPYGRMSEEEFNKKLGQLRLDAENAVEDRSESLLRYQLAARAKTINRLMALLNIKAKFNTIDGFFTFIHDNLGLSPMRPDAKTMMSSIDTQIEQAKKELRELDSQYDNDADGMSDKNLYDYLQNNLVSANAHKDIAIEIEQENAVLNAWSSVVGGHMSQIGTPRYKQRIEAIKKAREENKKLNWMISEIESGDAITKLDEEFAKEDAKTAKNIAKEVHESVTTDAMPDFELRNDGQKSNLRKNKEEFYARRERAKSRKLNRRNAYRKGGRLMVGIPFQNVFLDIANELMYAAEVGVYKFQEFVSDLKEYAQNNDINFNDYINDIKQFYIRFRAKAPKEIKDNLDTAQEVISFNTSNNPQIDPDPDQEVLTLQEKIQKQSSSIIRSISTHFDTIAQDENGVHVYTNKEAVKYQFSENVYVKTIASQLQEANKSDEQFRQALTQLAFNHAGFPIEDYVHYRNVDGIEMAIARSLLSNTNTYVQVGIAVRSMVQAIFADQIDTVDKSYFGTNVDIFIKQVKAIQNELEAGLTIVSTPDYLLYTDKDGNYCSALADVVFTDNDGNLYIIDVRSTTFPSIRTHYTYINRKGFTIEEQVKDTLKEADAALAQLSGKAAKGLYMLPVVVSLEGRSANVEYADGKGLLQVKDRLNPDIQQGIEQLEIQAKKAIDQLNQSIQQYNDAIDEAGSYNTKYSKIAERTFEPQSSAALYQTYIRNLSVELDDIQEAIRQLDDHIAINMSTIEDTVAESLFGNIDVKFTDAQEAYENLKQCATELDSALEEMRSSGLLITKATTYDERALLDKFISSIIDTQVALDVVLTKEELYDLNVSQELNLIQSALQEISKHRDNFGKAGIFVQNWWINNFAFGIKNNTTDNIASVGDQHAAYIRAINAWRDSIMVYDDSNTKNPWKFNKDLVNVLDDPKNVILRRLWTSMIHNGFAKLVDNFKQTGTQDPNDLKKIAFAEYIINQFDLLWGTEVDPELTNSTEDRLERINNLSVKWRDLYNNSESHSPAYQSGTNDGLSMAQNKIYYIISTMPNFPNNAKISFHIKNGELGIDITAVAPDGRNIFTWLPFLSKPYPGITPAEYRRMQIVNRGNLKFIDKVKDLLEYAKQHPEYEIRFDVSTDKGSIRYDDPSMFHKVQDWLLAGKNLFTIKLSKTDGIGILKTVITDQNGKFYYVFGGDQLKEPVGSFDDEFRKQNITTNTGALIYFKDTGSGQKIGVPIEPAKIGTQMATTIVDLIQKQAQGILQQDGFTIESLLRLVLYMKDPSGRISSYNNISSLVQVDGANVKIGTNNPLNAFSERSTLITAIANLNISTDSEILNQFFQTSNLQCLQRAKQRIAYGEKSVTLPLGITITEDDVTHQNEVGANGSTWLGYMLRNGLLQTRAIGQSYKQLNISNVRLENKNNPSTQKAVVESKPKSSLTHTIDLDAILAKVRMIVQEDQLVNRTSVEDRNSFTNNVDEYFVRVFGEDNRHFWQILQKDIIEKLPTGYAVGECTSNIMKLSMYAPESAAWHEAFHRVTELLLDSNQRESLYKMYSETYGKTNDRDIAEGLADLFVDYVTKTGLPNGKFFGRVKRFFKSLIPYIVLGKKLGYKNTYHLFSYFNDINDGAFRKATASEEAKNRFKALFNDSLYYTVTNSQTGQKAELEHVVDSGQLGQLVNSIGYYVVKALGYDTINPNLDKKVKIDESVIEKIDKDILDELCGNNVPEDKLTSTQRTFKEILDKKNFGAISKMVSDYIEGILNVQARGKIQKPEDEANDPADFGENIDPQNLNIDRYDKASYEFSKLASLSNRVKLFFATIPYYRFNDEGQLEEDTTRNLFGTPTFMPIEEVYSILENDLSDVKSIDELYQKLAKLARVSEMHAAVFVKFHELVYGKEDEGGIYGSDQFGNLICRDYDREQLAIQIVSALSSQKLDFIVALSENLGVGKGKDVRISSSSLERDSRSLPMQWSRIFTSGQSQVFATSKDKSGNIQFKDRKLHRKGEDDISKITNFIQQVREALTLNNGIVVIDGKEYNKDSVDGIRVIKDELIKNFHKVGVMVSAKAFDYMLLNGFGDTGAVGLADCLNGVGNISDFKPQSIESFISLLNGIVDVQGNIDGQVIEKGYPDNGFIKQLAKWQGMYNRVTVQNMALGLNGKQLFSISQNSAISHIIQAINTGDINNDVIRTLTSFNYNIDGDKIPIGSIILKAIKTKLGQKITAHTYIGLKTDNFGDNGSEYTDAAEIDDYIAKLSMLQDGYALFPTLADKGTWIVLKGLLMPGMRLLTNRKKGKVSVRCENPVQVTFVGGKPYIMPSDDVIDQMLEYAYTERAAIIQCMEDLKSMPDSAKVKNYHTTNKNTPRDKNGKPKFVVEPNGTRFLQLSKVYVQENGKLVGKNLNDPKKSSKDMLDFANEVFFSQPIEKQRRIMGLTLAVQAEHEVQKALDLGIVERRALDKTWKNGAGQDVNVKFTSEEKTLWNLTSQHLNSEQISAVASELLKQIPNKDGGTWATIDSNKNRDELFAKMDMVHGLAVAAILADATFRHIISSQEVLRCFAGHPGMFKVEYTEDGIKNSTADIQKRLGGLVSTGEDNVQNIPNVPSTYVCAELNDYEIASRSNVSKNLTNMFVTAQVRNVYAILTGRWDDVYGMSTEEIVNATKGSEYEGKIQKAIYDGEKFANMFDGGINVADGAAYITDIMCENLLRMRGAYNNKVKEAFDILRSDKAYSWKKSKEAYKTIYDAVNLVTTKYTAYGFRSHIIGGQQYSNISVPYYNKYALFPLFKCIASGKMGNIYQKMLDEGVDMLMMTSAVKVGSCGAVSFNGDEIDQPFNKYEQDFGYLRRQLNTDPEEGEQITMGTQMVKICLQNLIGDRVYTDARTGRIISGDEILEDMMGAINNLSQIGEREILEMFSDDGVTVSPQKLATYLQEQLTSRNANKVILDIIRPYTNSETGEVNLHALSATADASWIESIVISTVNKHVIDIATPGSSFVQRSVFAMEAKDGEGSIQGDQNISEDINGGKRLQMLNKDGSMDCVISINFFDDLFKGKNMSFEEKRQFLIKNGIIGEGSKANIVAYRIPTQAQSSIHALRVADVIPAVKDTIILPEEFTRITGSDFDIDHLYLARYNYRYDKNQDKMTSWMKKGTKEYYQNKLLGNILTLLTDINSINTTYKSIDSDVELPKGCSEQIKQNQSLEAEPYNFGTLRAQVSVKNDFISGKVSIGPFALNSTNHMLTSHFNVKFRSTVVTENTRIKGFTTQLDEDGNFISAWLSGYISGAVDNAKDPFLAKLNTNQFTYNMLNLLLRNGFGETAVWFCAQPIIRDMSAANERSKSQYAKDQSYKNSGYSRKDYAIIQAVKKYVPEHALSAQALKKWTTSTQKQDLWSRVEAINWVDKNREILRSFAVNPSLKNITIDNVDYSREYVQQKVFFAWKSLEKYATALGGLVQHTKIDTRKHGKSIIEINRYLDEYLDIFEPVNPSIWDVQGLQDFARRTWIEQKTKAAIAMPSFILGKYTFAANPNFIKAVLDFGHQITEPGESLSTDVANKISRHLQTAVKSKYFVDYVANNLVSRDKDGNPTETASEHIRKLFVGPRSMSKRLTGLKLAIELNPVYKRLETNGLVRQLFSATEDNPQILHGELTEMPAFINVLDNVDSSKINSDLLTDGWEDLLRDQDPYVRAFAQDLIIYAFMTSGEFKGWTKLFKYVPASWITGEVNPEYESYASYVERILANGYDYTQHFDEIAANCFGDRSIVELTPMKNHDDTANFVDHNSVCKIGKAIDITEMNAVKPYISVKEDQNSKNTDAYNLYKLVGFKHYGEEVVCPVYIRIKKQGYQKSLNNIYEYGWDFQFRGNENRIMNEKYDVHNAIEQLSQDSWGYNTETAKEIQVRYLQLAKPHQEDTESGVTTGNMHGIQNSVDYSDWQYLEDSGYSGVLESLPEKIKQNGNFKDNPALRESSNSSEHKQC